MKNAHQPSNGKPFHSSEIVKLTRGDVIGSLPSTSDTFRKRATLERERRHVPRYRDSHVVWRRTAGSQPVSYDQARRSSSQLETPQRPDEASDLPTRQRFVEPVRKKYNPYD